jgi:hypothetical protein
MLCGCRKVRIMEKGAFKTISRSDMANKLKIYEAKKIKKNLSLSFGGDISEAVLFTRRVAVEDFGSGQLKDNFTLKMLPS